MRGTPPLEVDANRVQLRGADGGGSAARKEADRMAINLLRDAGTPLATSPRVKSFPMRSPLSCFRQTI